MVVWVSRGFLSGSKLCVCNSTQQNVRKESNLASASPEEHEAEEQSLDLSNSRSNEQQKKDVSNTNARNSVRDAQTLAPKFLLGLM